MTPGPSPEVSVIMPVWQPTRSWLREAVASVLEERDCELELIVVDDGNEEPTHTLLDGVTDERVQVLRVEHGGAYAARNAGLSCARGQWIRYVDADDVVANGSTARLLRLARSRPDTISYGVTVMCDEDLRPMSEIFTAVDGSAEELCVTAAFEVRVVSMLFPRNTLELAGDWDVSFGISGDWEYVLRTLEHAGVRGDESPATYYRRHQGSMTLTADVRAGEESWHRILDGYFARHPGKRGSELQRRAERRLLVDRANAYAHVGARRQALLRLVRLCRLDAHAGAAMVLEWTRHAAGSRLARR
jgi:glycosyltransferase involved in cell wall biosynthesis